MDKYSISAMCRLLNIPRRRIGYIMAKYKLVSNYTTKQYKVHKSKCNEDNIKNRICIWEDLPQSGRIKKGINGLCELVQQ